ncbi:MAG: mechanosensitive ion channel family protein [Lachnospiraceae bacterium]|jgi:small conductance mechanosensitive channel|nr:mechanosensitive ion channel family protein [Lachnospiraceae bacterium]
MQILQKAGSAGLAWLESMEATGQGEGLPNLNLGAIVNTLKSGLPGIAKLCSRLLFTGIILLIGLRIIHSAKKFLNRTFERMEMEISLRKFLVSLTNAMMYMLLALIIAEKLGINPTSLIAVIGSAGVAVALSLQESLSNFAGGIVILIMKPFKVGDYIITSQAEGTVTNIGLIYTQLLTVDNKSVVIPNGGLANSSITNVTAENERRLDFYVNISYQSNLRKAKNILFQLMDTHPYTLHEEGRMPEAFVWELGESAVVLGCRVWVLTENYWKLKFDITEAVKLRYDEEGIEIPYCQLDVTIKNQAVP